MIIEDQAVPEVSILVIGDELIRGYTRDENGAWLAERMRRHGLTVRRIVILSDDVEEVAEQLQRELDAPRPRLVVTTGGVGPTPDDRTYEAVARCTGQTLENSPRIGEWIADWCAKLDRPASAAAMESMAAIPTGGYLLAPDVTGGPIVALDISGGISSAGGATIVMLPGVPEYVRQLTIKGIEPELLAHFRGDVVTIEIPHELHEALLMPMFELVADQFPSVKVGSYVGEPNLLRLEGPERTTRRAAAAVRGRLSRAAGPA